MNGQIIMPCSVIDAYVGLDDCNTFDKQPLGIILTHKDYAIDVVSADHVYAQLVEAAKDISKVLPFLEGLVNVESSGGNLRISQEGFGNPSVNGYEPFQETYTFVKGGLCLYESIAHLNGANMRAFFVDEALNVYGTLVDGGVPSYRGFDVNVGIEYRKNVGTQGGAIKITLLYAYAYAQQFKATRVVPLYEPIRGLRQVVLRVTSISDTSFKLRFVMACSGVNITRITNETWGNHAEIRIMLDDSTRTVVGPNSSNYVMDNFNPSNDYYEITTHENNLLKVAIPSGTIHGMFTDLFLGLNPKYVPIEQA